MLYNRKAREYTNSNIEKRADAGSNGYNSRCMRQPTMRHATRSVTEDAISNSIGVADAFFPQPLLLSFSVDYV